MNIAKTKLEFLFTKELLGRISYPEQEDMVVIDLHYLTCRDAEKLVKNVIALTDGSFTMELIHGYNSGTKIKELLYTSEISSRIKDRKSPGYNLGVTQLTIAA